MNDNLLHKTLELLRAANVPMLEIARATGLKHRWLHRLKAGDFEDPGVNKIEILHRYLSQHVGSDRMTADAQTDAGMPNVATPAAADPSTVDGEAA